MESAHRTSLAKGEVGIRDKKQSLTLARFCDERFELWAKSTFEKSSPKTWLDFYRAAEHSFCAKWVCMLVNLKNDSRFGLAGPQEVENHSQGNHCQVTIGRWYITTFVNVHFQ